MCSSCGHFVVGLTFEVRGWPQASPLD
jgi:hypothetical protein